MDVIIYTTNTGSAERYAKLLAQETGLPVYSFAEAKKQVFSKAKIIWESKVSWGLWFSAYIFRGLKDFHFMSVCFGVWL